jgi:hypothetical protein
MEGMHFDDLLRSLTQSRRALAAGALATVAGLLVGPGVDARNKRKKRKPKKPEPNEFGCLEIGAACKGAEQCCSGICDGKKGKRKCQAHDTSLCTPEKNFCTAGVVTACNGANVRAVCMQTTGKAAFCGDLSDPGGIACRVCARDVDCQEEFGPGAACIDLGGEICKTVCTETGGTACVPSGAPTAA